MKLLENDIMEDTYHKSATSEDDSSENELEILQSENRTKTDRKRKIATTEDNLKKKKLKKELYAPPTVEEINQLRETQNLFNSNLFRLQIEELLKEIYPRIKVKNQIQSWFTHFKNIIDDIKETKEYELQNPKLLKKLKIDGKLPINLPEPDRGFFKYLKSSNVSLLNSSQLDCSVWPHINIDIILEIPTKCFHKTDAINGRYLLKRAVYLSYIASHLKKFKTFKNCMFTYLNGNELKPILVLELSKNVNFRVHAIIQDGLLKKAKFNPSKNNVKGEWFFENDNGFESSTPFYNSTILEDLTLIENYKFAFDCVKDFKNILDGYKLLQVWLKQRELDTGFGAFTSELILMLIVYLIKNKKLNNAMSSYQVIRNVWIHLGASDWSTVGKGISLCNTEKIFQPTLSEFHQHYPIVFVDFTGYYNLASFLNLQIYFKIQDESKRAVQYLDNIGMNNFRILFTTKMPFSHQYDQIVQITDVEQCYDVCIERYLRLDYLTFHNPPLSNFILNILAEGLKTRTSLIVPQLNSIPSWPIDSEPPNKTATVITIGLNLNANNAFNIIDKGPAANLPKAKDFREFWGDKSQLRRFNDGSISEAVIWEEKPNFYKKRKICSNIIDYLLKNKCGLSSENILHFCDQMSDLLIEPDIKKISDETSNSGEERIVQTILDFNELSKQIRNLNDLPLDVTAVSGVSSIFRYSDVFPCVQTQLSVSEQSKTMKGKIRYRTKEVSFVPPFEIVVNLALSGKWPNDFEAIRRLKVAFYIKIAQALEKSGLKCIVHTEYLDIMKNNHIFRLRISNPKEIALLKKTIDEDGVTKYRDSEESLNLEKSLIHLPKLTSALSGLHSQHSSFGTAARLAKRWLRAQMLDDSHLPDIVVDLLMASLYLSPEPYDVPKLPQIGFVRFLHKMATSDWQTDPLIVNFNEEITAEQIVEIDTLFNKNRSTLPSLFVATPYDQTSSIWTKQAPSQQILVRIAILAKESLNFIQNIFSTQNGTNFNLLFTPSLNGYDLIIKLKPLVHIQSDETAMSSTNRALNAVIGPDPYQLYLKELRDCYGDFALFFHNTYGGDCIAVLWKPNALELKEFKVSLVNGRKLIITEQETAKLIINKEAILEDFTILGKDLVQGIETRKK